MKMQNIRNSLFGLLMIGLLAGMSQDALAQRPAASAEGRSDAKRPARAMINKEKAEKQSSRQRVRKERTSKSAQAQARYSRNEKRKRHYQDSNRCRKSYKRNKSHAYKQRNRNNHFPIKKRWQRGHYRRAAWVDYHRPGYRYPRIGMHVSVLPFGHISLAIGNLRFYAYRGVYYRYDPALRVYVVVNKPRIETWQTSAIWDRIILMDGSTVEGVYRYSENDMVFFEIGDALLEIPMSEIKVMYLSEN